MRGTTSARTAHHRPARLMQRLAALQDGPKASKAYRAPRRSRKGIYFVIGLLGGVLSGAAALFVFEVITPAGIRILGDRSVEAARTMLASWTEPSMTPTEEPSPLATAQAEQVHAFEVVIDRSTRASAPFALRLVGSEDESIEVLVRGLPADATLSRGERLDLSTWALKAADLKDLHLALSESTPDAFEMRIEVAASPDVAAATTVARVRLVEMPANDSASTAAIERPPSEPVAGAASVDTPFQTEVVMASKNRAAGTKTRTTSASPPLAASCGRRRSATNRAAPLAGRSKRARGNNAIGQPPGVVEDAAANLVAVPRRRRRTALTSVRGLRAGPARHSRQCSESDTPRLRQRRTTVHADRRPGYCSTTWCR